MATWGKSRYGVSRYAVASTPAAPVPGQLSLPVQVTVQAVSGEISLPVRVQIAAVGALSLPVAVSVVEPSTAGHYTDWRVVVLVDGVDVSARLTGEVDVDALEGSSRVASFAVAQAGTDELGWSGRTVKIYTARGDGSEQRLQFSGRIDTPTIDLASRVAAFDCVASVQAACANAPFAELASLIGGRHAPSVFGDALDGWQYASAMIRTVPAALETGPTGALRVVPWAAGAPDVTFARAVDGSVRLSLQSWADLRNVVELEYQYRYPLLHQRLRGLRWDHLPQPVVAQLDLWYPSRETVQQAVDSVSGWVPSVVNFEAVPAGSYNFGTLGGTPIIHNVPPDVAPLLCLGASVSFRARWRQSKTERYVVRARNAASVARYGAAVEAQVAGALESVFDDEGWEDRPRAAGEVSQVVPYEQSPATSLAAAAEGLQTVVDMARTTVLARARLTELAFALPLQPDLDLIHTVRLTDVQGVTATGKARQVRHRLNLGSGRAVTEVVLAISGQGVVGVQPYTPPVAPDAPEVVPTEAAQGLDNFKADTWYGGEKDSPPYDPETMFGFTTNRRLFPSPDDPQYDIENAEQYPVGFSIRSAQIEAAARDPIDETVEATYDVVVPVDELELT